jgi:hypothetical protein
VREQEPFLICTQGRSVSGISTVFYVRDILNLDQFWDEQLRKVNKDRLFGCMIPEMQSGSKVQGTILSSMFQRKKILIACAELIGLITSHAYSILDALEVGGVFCSSSRFLLPLYLLL